MLVPPGKFNDLRNFCFGDLKGEEATNTNPVAVNQQHDLHGFVAVLAKYPF
jgi:hypothetical protein